MAILNSPTFWLNLTRLMIVLFTGFIAWMTYKSHLLLKEIQPDFNVLLSWPESVVRLLLVGVCLFLVRLSGLPAAELGLISNNLWRSIGLGFGVGIATQLTINLVMFQAIKHFGRNIYSPWLIRNIIPHRHSQWALIALAFLPPVAMEELLFRSLWLGIFQPIMPLAILIIGTSTLFGFMHQPQGKLGMIAAGAINMFFCILFVWTGELLITLTAHYTVNLLQVVVAYFQQDWLENY